MRLLLFQLGMNSHKIPMYLLFGILGLLFALCLLILLRNLITGGPALFLSIAIPIVILGLKLALWKKFWLWYAERRRQKNGGVI